MTHDMDTTKTITHVSLCAGYGGIDLGLSRTIPSLRTVAFSEIEAFACANLVAKMEAGLLDAAPIWTDLKTFPWSEFCGRVDLLSGGYPCQPFSAAGKRLGKDDPRHLWPFIADGIRLMRPRLCFFENVEGHITLGLSSVISDLEELGYKVSWGIFSAREVGAPHQRKRIFILAYCQQQGLEGFRRDGNLINQQGWIGQEPDRSTTKGSVSPSWPSRPGQPQYGWEPPRVVDSASARQQAQRDESFKQRREGFAGEPSELANTQSSMSGVKAEREWRENTGGRSEEIMGNTESLRSTARRPEHEGLGGKLCSSSAGGEGVVGNSDSKRLQDWPRQGGSAIQGTHANGREDSERQAEPSLGRDADGTSSGMGNAEMCITCDNRTDELRLLGNGVVPATAERAFRTLLEELI